MSVSALSSPTASTALPNILDESGVNRFTFLLNGQLQEGMRWHETLYGMVCQFHTNHVQQINQTAAILLAQHLPIQITMSEYRWVIWLDLKYFQALAALP